jgi:hypothetical protein
MIEVKREKEEEEGETEEWYQEVEGSLSEVIREKEEEEEETEEWEKEKHQSGDTYN